MIIAVASGKGGTGKTTVATSLALILTGEPGQALVMAASPPPLFLDCDVEAPNAHLFLKPVFDQMSAGRYSNTTGRRGAMCSLRDVRASVPVPCHRGAGQENPGFSPALPWLR
jgi:MinD superfamily P-loop ATPase